MSGTSAPANHFPPGVAVRPHGRTLLLCDTGVPNKAEKQVVRTRARTTDNVQEILSNEQPHPVVQLSAEARQTDGVAKRDLYVVVGVLVPQETTAEAKKRAGLQFDKLRTIQDFNPAIHHDLIAPKNTTMHTVVVPIWPCPEWKSETIQISARTTYFVLGDMQDGLCQALRVKMSDDPNFFFYPEWVRPEVDLARDDSVPRVDKWSRYVKQWRAEYRADHGPQHP